VERGEPSKQTQMMLAPGGDLVEIVARGDRGAGQKQQHLGQGMDDPPWLAVIRKIEKMLQQRRAPWEHPRRRKSRLCRPWATSCDSGRARESHHCVKAKSPLTRRFNQTSEPWTTLPGDLRISLESGTIVSPMRLLRWASKSPDKPTMVRRAMGHKADSSSPSTLLRELNYCRRHGRWESERWFRGPARARP
jgi:hypothetical protein